MFFLLVPAVLAAMLGWSFFKREQAERMVTLDSGLSQSAQTQVLTAIATAKDPAQLDALVAQYSSYPYTVYELQLRAWELRGSAGTPPKAPTGPGVSVEIGPTGQPEAPGVLEDLQAIVEQAVASAASKMGLAGPDTAPSTPPPSPTTPAPTPMPPVGAPGGDSSPSVPAGPGWTALPSITESQYTWSAMPGIATITADVAVEIARLSSTQLNGTVYERAPDGATWKFDGANAVIIAYVGTPVATQQASGDPMASYSPLTSEYREDVAGNNHVGAAATPKAPKAWKVNIRQSDKVWPRTIAAIGSGVKGGSRGSLQHLTDINPQLVSGGALRQLVAGDYVNVPAGWVPNLRNKGFELVGEDSE